MLKRKPLPSTKPSELAQLRTSVEKLVKKLDQGRAASGDAGVAKSLAQITSRLGRLEGLVKSNAGKRPEMNRADIETARTFFKSPQ